MVLRPQSSTREFEPMTSRSWQYSSCPWDNLPNIQLSGTLKGNVLPHYLWCLRWLQIHGVSDRCTGNWYVWVWLWMMYYVPQVQPDQGLNTWLPDHDITFHVPKTPVLTTRPAGLININVLPHYLRCLRSYQLHVHSVRLMHWQLIFSLNRRKQYVNQRNSKALQDNLNLKSDEECVCWGGEAGGEAGGGGDGRGL